MKHLILTLTLLLPILVGAQGVNCADMDPICTDVGANFTANTGTTAEAGNDYGCLSTQPNPSWYYFEVATNGNIDMSLTAGSDIDFVIWGPFNNLADAQGNCGTLNAGQIVDCSYSSTNTETPSIPNAQVGEVYIMLITNYAAVVQNITLTQTGGTGSTDCSVVANPPCFMSYFNANIGACETATGTYTVTGQVDFEDPPTTGDLVVEDCNGNTTVVASAPFTVNAQGQGTENYTLAGLNADGLACDVSAYFTADPGCSIMNLAYTAPECLCTFTFMSINQGACDPVTNTFTVSGSVEFDSPPTTGTLTFTDCEGNTDTYFAPFTSPQTYSLPGITPNGTTGCTVTAVFSADPTCTMTSLPFDDPANCDCPVNIGTFTETTTGNTTAQYELCFGDSFTFVPNGDFIPHDDQGAGVATAYDPGIEILLYNCPPTVGPPNGITADPCLAGIVSNGTGVGGWTITNNIGDGSTFWYAPVSMYNWQDNTYAIIYSGSVCYDLGFAYPITFLEDITETTTQDCFAGTATSTISGGTPAWDGSNFTAVAGSLTPANAMFNNTTCANGGTITISGLVDGDVFSYDVVDDNGCPITITGTFVGTQDASFSYDFKYCQDDTDPLPVITGVAGGTFSSTPGLSINPFTGLIDLSASTPGNYDITYQSPAVTCWGTETWNLTINPIPNVVATEDSPICDDGISTIQLDETGGEATAWLWTSSGAATFDFDTIQNPVVSGAVNGETFTVTGTNVATGCVNTANVSVTVNPMEDASFTTTDFCFGSPNSATVTGTTGGAFAFNPLPGDGATINPTTGEISNETSGATYTIEYTTPGVCFVSSTQDVTVFDLPNVTTSDVTICLGGSIDITASGAATYTWAPGTWLNQTTGATVTTTPLANTAYTVTGTDANGCQNTAVSNVTVSGNAAIDAGPDVTICAGQNTTLTATGGVTYTWDNGLGVGNGFVVTPGTTTTYTVDGTDAIGCTGQDQITVTVNPLPTVDPIADQTICNGDNTAAVNFTGAIAGTTYDWTNNNATIGLAPAGTGNIAAFSAVNNGATAATATITVTPTANGCVGAAETFTFTVNPTPTVDPITDQTICAGDLTTAVNFTGAVAGTTYDWTNTNTGIGLGANGTGNIGAFTGTNTGASPISGTITVTPTANTCVGAAENFTFTVNPLPTATIAGTASVCEGDASPTITFTGANGVAPYTFTYNINGGTSQQIVSTGNTATIAVPTTPTGTFNYNLESVMDASATTCSQAQTGTATITVNPNPTPTIQGVMSYCTGTFATLSTDQPYATYDWSTGDNTPTTDVTVADNSITVTVTNAFGCSGVSPAVDVIENTVIVYNSVIEICQGESATIHGVVQTVAGTYDQTFPLPTGCDSTASVQLIVNPLPVIDAGIDQTECEGTAVTLSATGAPNIVWDNAVVDGVPFTPGVGAVTYEATGTDANGCVNTDQVDVTINPTPTVDPITDQTVCNGTNTVDVNFSGPIAGTTFDWTNNNTTIGLAAAGTGDIPSFTGINATGTAVTATISVTPTANGCPGTPVDFTITIDPSPTVDPIVDQTVCNGTNTTAVNFTSPQAGTTFDWSNTDPTIGLAAAGTGNIASFTGVNTGTAPVTATISVTPTANGCVGTASDFTITIDPSPTVDAIADQTLCDGTATAAINFTSPTVGTTYDWVNDMPSIGLAAAGNGNIASFNAVNTGQAAVTATITITPTANGCTGPTESFTITVDPPPYVDPILDDELCTGDATNAVTFTSATAGVTFDWVNDTPGIGLAAFGNGDIASFNALNGGAAPVIATIGVAATANGCTGPVETFTITVNPLPNIFAGNDFTVCDGQQAILTGSGGVAYVWDNGVTDGVPFTPTASGTYTVIGTDANGCVNQDDVDLTVEPLPLVSFIADVTAGCAPLEVTFTNTTPGNLTDCVWSFSDGTTITGCGSVTTVFQNGGLYDATLTTTSSNGCTNTLTYDDYIFVEEAPLASFVPSSSVVSVFNTQVHFNNTSVGAVSYTWDFGDNGAGSTDVSPTHSFPDDASGTYVVELIAASQNNCLDTAYHTIVVNEELIFYVPNTFTPDSDDFNEYFQAVFTSGYDPYDFNLYIFDRWGEIIWESHDANVGWDGTYGANKQKIVQDGTYTWKIDFKTTLTDERIQVVGHVNVLR